MGTIHDGKHSKFPLLVRMERVQRKVYCMCLSCQLAPSGAERPFSLTM